MAGRVSNEKLVDDFLKGYNLRTIADFRGITEELVEMALREGMTLRRQEQKQGVETCEERLAHLDLRTFSDLHEGESEQAS